MDISFRFVFLHKTNTMDMLDLASELLSIRPTNNFYAGKRPVLEGYEYIADEVKSYEKPDEPSKIEPLKSSPSEDSSQFMNSVFWGAVTDNAALGGVMGGSLLGGIIGDTMNGG